MGYRLGRNRAEFIPFFSNPPRPDRNWHHYTPPPKTSPLIFAALRPALGIQQPARRIGRFRGLPWLFRLWRRR